MSLDPNSPLFLAVIGLVSVAIGVLFGPLLKDVVVSCWEKRRLRKGFYRELARWYELAVWYVRDYDRKSENLFFAPSVFDVRPEAPQNKKKPSIGESILQAERSSQIRRQIGRIGRGSLQWKIGKLQETFDRVNVELAADNLHSKTLSNENQLQLFYKLKECARIAECYEDFRYALEYRLTSYDSVPNSRFLTPEEAKELSELEARLDWLKLTYLAVAQAEDSGDFDMRLLNKMRMGKRRGTMIHSTGEAAETARWCLQCKQYSEPVTRPLEKERCKHCENVLLTIDELTKKLSSNSIEQQKQAADALAKTYRYNKSELTRDNVRGLTSALCGPLPEVRRYAAIALMYISKRLERVKDGQSIVNLKGEVVNALITRLSCTEQEPRVRKAAIWAIGRICYGTYNAGKARKPLARALDDVPEIIAAAAWAIGVIGDEKLFSSVQAMLKRPSFYAQDYAPAALEALGCFGRFDKDSVQLFVDVISDTRKRVAVRRTAAAILGNIGDVSEVWEPLTQIGEDPHTDPDLQADVKRALASLTPQYREAAFQLKK